MTYPDARCTCGHHAGVHTPTGSLSDTAVRGVGYCTVTRCPCERFHDKDVTTGAVRSATHFAGYRSSPRATDIDLDGRADLTGTGGVAPREEP